jgi:hypothetical protein
MSNQNDGKAMLVQVEALSRALKLLNAAGCQYAVIDSAGTKHGTLELASKCDEAKKRNHPPGAYLEHHKHMTEAMKPGDSITIPLGKFGSKEDRESLRSSISGYCSREWGAGTYITASVADGIELLRVE